MRFLAAAMRAPGTAAELEESAVCMLSHFNGVRGTVPRPSDLARDAFDLAEGISRVIAALRVHPTAFAALSCPVRDLVREAERVYLRSYGALLPAVIPRRGFAALKELLDTTAKPESCRESGTRRRRLMSEAFYFQNALHNYAIGFEHGLPTGAESVGGARPLVIFSQAENVILFPGRTGAERTAFDDIFGDGDRDR